MKRLYLELPHQGLTADIYNLFILDKFFFSWMSIFLYFMLYLDQPSISDSPTTKLWQGLLTTWTIANSYDDHWTPWHEVNPTQTIEVSCHLFVSSFHSIPHSETSQNEMCSHGVSTLRDTPPCCTYHRVLTGRRQLWVSHPAVSTTEYWPDSASCAIFHGRLSGHHHLQIRTNTPNEYRPLLHPSQADKSAIQFHL